MEWNVSLLSFFLLTRFLQSAPKLLLHRNQRHISSAVFRRRILGWSRFYPLDFTQFEKYPKWIIGFSDITVFHSHLHQHLKVASIHAKMCNSFPSDWAMAEPLQRTSIESIRDCLTGKKMIYESPYHSQQLSGKCSGLLVGGNLKTIESLSASVSDISTKGKILFLECKLLKFDLM